MRRDQRTFIRKDVLTIEVDSALGSMATLKPHLPRLRALGIYVEVIRYRKLKIKPLDRKGMLWLTEPGQLAEFLVKLDRS